MVPKSREKIVLLRDTQTDPRWSLEHLTEQDTDTLEGVYRRVTEAILGISSF